MRGRRSSSAEGAAAHLLSTVLHVPWLQTLDGFRKTNQDISAEPFHGEGAVTFFDNYWSHRALAESSGIRTALRPNNSA